jgi:hypothetical protein
MSVNICEFCGCEFLWGHACGESCLCDMCSECDKVKSECQCEKENAIGVYLDESLICVPCSTTGEGERATAQALPDGFTCDNCLEVVNV